MTKTYFGWEVDDIFEELDYYPDQSDRLNDFIHSIGENDLGELQITSFESLVSGKITQRPLLSDYFSDIFNPTLAEVTLFELEFNVPYPLEQIREVFLDE